MIKLIGFDLDDTLWDVAPIIRNAESHLNQWLIENVPALKFDVISMRELRHEMLIKEPHLVNQITEMRRRLIERAMLLSGLEIRPQTDILMMR
jgi:putative hydrolase of the HAD superfamily